MIDITKQHILTTLSKGSREDERAFTAYRPITVEYGISPKSAEGSARVTIGKTEVVVGIKLEIASPFPDRPDEGTIIVNAELLPLSNPEFESGPPSVEAIELSRVVDRAIREGKALDFKKLSITPGEKAWIVLIDIYPINDDGNLFDAAALCSIAALKNAKFPKVEDDKISYGHLTNQSLPLEQLPISCTVLKIGDSFLVDPLNSEEGQMDARLTIGCLEDGNICALQKGGNAGLTIQDVEKMVEIAQEKTQELRRHL